MLVTQIMHLSDKGLDKNLQFTKYTIAISINYQQKKKQKNKFAHRGYASMVFSFILNIGKVFAV